MNDLRFGCRIWDKGSSGGLWTDVPSGVQTKNLGRSLGKSTKDDGLLEITMVALCNRADHYIFILFVSSFFLLLLFFLA